MAIETALEDVKVKEELKRGPELEEEERSKGTEGEGEEPISSVESWPSYLSQTHWEITRLLLFISGEISAESFPILNLCSLKYTIIYSSDWFFPLFKDSVQIAFLAGLEISAKTITGL